MRERSWTAACVCAAVSLASTPVFAQNAQVGDFSAQRFLPAPGNHNFLSVEGARIDGHGTVAFGVFGNYGYKPYVLQVCQGTGETCTGAATNDIDIVRDLVTVDLLGAVTLFRRLQIGFRLPYVSTTGDGVQADMSSETRGTRAYGGLKGRGIGDPMLELKVRAASFSDDRYVLGFSAFGTAPIGHDHAPNTFLGDQSVSAGARAIFDAQFGRLQLGVNLGGMYRKEGGIGQSTVGSELRYGVGASYQVAPLLYVLGDVFGSSRFSSASGTGALEADGALKLVPFGPRLGLLAGAGAGIVNGMGVPTWRAIFGLHFTNEVPDCDGDGILDDVDQCPTMAEDLDHFQDDDGCPDPDNDGDGVPDASDKCPNDPETKNGLDDQDGCPDEIPDRDNDGVADSEDKCPDDGGTTVVRRKGDFYGCPDRDRDGVPDKADKCPDEPEDTDGFQDEDGCPDPDNDADGVPDQSDECPDQKEVMNGVKDEDGCPDDLPDRDHDGINDSLDQCPDAPETYNGVRDDDGCPDGAALVEATGDALKIKDVINFAKDSDQIVGKRSFTILDAVAALMQHHPELFQIEVSGHTDDRGDHDHNVDLSKRRAETVVAYLHEKGVDTKRLTAAGFGPDKPIGDNKRDAGRAKNRRVEFNILQAAPKTAAAPAKATGTPPTTPPAAPKPTAPGSGSQDLGDL